MSKRTQSFQDDKLLVLVRVNEFLENGYLPDAVINFLTNIGWSFGNDREIFTVAETLERFSLDGVSPSPTKLPYSKLDWMNGQYIQALPIDELIDLLWPLLQEKQIEISPETLQALAPVINMRLKRLTDIYDQVLFLDDDNLQPMTADKAVHKKMGHDSAVAAFTAARDFLAGLTAEQFTVEQIGDSLRTLGEAHTDNGKAGPFLGTMRFVIARQQVSPPLFEVMVALGQQRTVARLDEALQILVR